MTQQLATEPFVLTTPLYYVNAPPHMGSIYTTMAAIAIARFQLDITYDKFVPTIDPKHEAIVKEFYSRVIANGDINRADCEELYCVNCKEYKVGLFGRKRWVGRVLWSEEESVIERGSPWKEVVGGYMVVVGEGKHYGGALHSTFWNVWKEHNRRIFEDVELPIHSLKLKILRSFFAWFKVAGGVPKFQIL